MSSKWWDESWNPITGCTPTSPGCDNCYAKSMATRFAGTAGYPKDDPFGVTFHPERLKTPLAWKKPRRIFVCSMADLFHEDVKQEWIDEIFNVMSNAPRHTFLVLTKRPERMKAALKDLGNRWKSNVFGGNCAPRWPLENVWLGVTAENQETAEERIPVLLSIPAEKRFVSVEPMLGAVDLKRLVYNSEVIVDALNGRHGCVYPMAGENNSLDWVICGGETGPKARPVHPDWVKDIRDQCRASSVPFFFKGWGRRSQFVMVPGRILDGRTWDEVPE